MAAMKPGENPLRIMAFYRQSCCLMHVKERQDKTLSTYIIRFLTSINIKDKLLYKDYRKLFVNTMAL